MIVALLVLIIFILLFGAGVVKGWLANAAGVGCAFAVLVGLVLWFGSFLGERGPEYVLYGIFGVLLLLALAAGVAGPTTHSEVAASEVVRTSKAEPRRSTTTTDSAEPPPAHRVWGWFVNDIRERFDPEAQNRARSLYEAGDALGLDRCCRGEIERLEQQQGRADESSHREGN